jgi:hypothetical protein
MVKTFLRNLLNYGTKNSTIRNSHLLGTWEQVPYRLQMMTVKQKARFLWFGRFVQYLSAPNSIGSFFMKKTMLNPNLQLHPRKYYSNS